MLELIILQLNSRDLQSVQLVSKNWFDLVNQLISHGELSWLTRWWEHGEPTVSEIQVKLVRFAYSSGKIFLIFCYKLT